MINTQLILRLNDGEVRAYNKERYGASAVASETVLRRTTLSVVPRVDESIVFTKNDASVHLKVEWVRHVMANNRSDGNSHRCEIVCRIDLKDDATVKEIDEVMRLKE